MSLKKKKKYTEEAKSDNEPKTAEDTKSDNESKASEEAKQETVTSVKPEEFEDDEEADNSEVLDKRELRRKRRRKNQIMAYTVVIVFIAVLAFGIVSAVRIITGMSSSSTEEQAQQSKVDEMFATEETLSVPETTESSQVVELTEEQKLDQIIDALIEVMPLEDKVAGLFIVTPESITGVNTAIKAGEGTQNALAEYSVGGIIYQSKNVQSSDQIKEMIDNTVLYSNYPLFIAVQEEGGDASSIATAGVGTKVDAAAVIAETNDPENAYKAGSTIGEYISALGFNLDFAPTADLNNVDNSVIGKRSYGSDASEVSEYVTSMLQGLSENNVTACLGHFPGIGSSTEDTSAGLASTDRSAEDFRANEFEVFKAGIEAGADMIMVSNMSAPALTGDNSPCSMSSAVVTDILRDELGFKGVIISEAMNKKAVSEYYGADEAAVLALRAGCDMILMPEDFEKAYNGVLAAVNDGTISEERINDSLKRIYRIKYADKVQ
jgi:beta-N-acetylhexosaminidase